MLEYSDNVISKNGIPWIMLTDVGYITLEDEKYHYYVCDYLGSVRQVINQDGHVEQTYTYYPSGTAIRDNQSASQPLRFCSKEDETPFGINWYDFGTRHYDSRQIRWITPDRMSDKHYELSPYLFCAGDPVNNFDPDGNDFYSIDAKGRITFMKKNNSSRLYFQDNNGEYITLSNDDVLKSLAEIKPLGEKRHKAFANSKHADDVFKVFKFAADHTASEWAVHRTGDTYTIGTTFTPDNAGSWEDYTNQKPEASVHSHPNEKPTISNETDSMGYNSPTITPGSDYQHVYNDVNFNGAKARISYVYFPISKRLYNVGYYGAEYIRKITSFKGFYFGTLHHR